VNAIRGAEPAAPLAEGDKTNPPGSGPVVVSGAEAKALVSKIAVNAVQEHVRKQINRIMGKVE
jgi:hypothetical protein